MEIMCEENSEYVYVCVSQWEGGYFWVSARVCNSVSKCVCVCVFSMCISMPMCLRVSVCNWPDVVCGISAQGR